MKRDLARLLRAVANQLDPPEKPLPWISTVPVRSWGTFTDPFNSTTYSSRNCIITHTPNSWRDNG